MTGLAGRRVLFICELGPPFTGQSFRTAGVGGTESIIVLLADACAARGASVVVANRVPVASVEGTVRYVPLDAIGPGPFDVIVLVKHWSQAAEGREGRKIFLWTDAHVMPGAQLARCREWADVSCTMSEFQRPRLAAATGDQRLVALGCMPIETGDYATAPVKTERWLLYCSVPDRGLYYLKDLFPRIRRQVPDARLAITSDFTLWGAQPAKEAFLRFFDGSDGVDYVGHVSRSELVAWQHRARVLAYPCTFEEGFCLSAAECMAAGAVPVTTGRYALVQTVADGGVLIDGHPRSWLYRRRFVRACVELLTDDARWRAYVERGRSRALSEFAPGHVLDRMLQALESSPPR
ncbi:MAG TPA: glycosyltransferase [Vicinamibacterales bacterium]